MGTGRGPLMGWSSFFFPGWVWVVVLGPEDVERDRGKRVWLASGLKRRRREKKKRGKRKSEGAREKKIRRGGIFDD